MAAGQRSKKKTKKPALRLNLALQGGGAHGAFTWGILERLLEEEDIEIVGITGTSAGAINAALLADGLAQGGRGKARDQLAEFWKEVSAYGAIFAPWQHSPFDTEGHGLRWLDALNPFDVMTRTFSPYELNPLNINPLRDLLYRFLDNRHLQGPVKLFVTATNVHTGQPKVFRDKEVTIDTLLASSCIPFIFQAVEIDGTPYWDGGYMGNPSIWPLFYNTDCDDVLLVQINPLCRVGTPRRAIDIVNRLNEITFNASLISEMRAINFMKRLIDKGELKDRRYKAIRMHLVNPPSALHGLTASSKTDLDWDFFQMLHGAGRDAMEQWLRQHKAAIGKKATIDIAAQFLSKKPYVKKTANTMKEVA